MNSVEHPQYLINPNTISNLLSFVFNEHASKFNHMQMIIDIGPDLDMLSAHICKLINHTDNVPYYMYTDGKLDLLKIIRSYYWFTFMSPLTDLMSYTIELLPGQLKTLSVVKQFNQSESKHLINCITHIYESINDYEGTDEEVQDVLDCNRLSYNSYRYSAGIAYALYNSFYDNTIFHNVITIEELQTEPYFF